MKKHVLYFSAFALLAVPVHAQEAPPPRKMPREPVHREAIQDHKSAVPATREIEGPATIIDGEKLHVGDFDLRLFGVVPPQLSASFGPQARTMLDGLTAGQTVTCLIRDRDREERFLATCHNANNADLALELLRHGLAVTARGSIAATELAAPYIAAEQAAIAQKLGLWSVAVPTAAIIAEMPKTDSTTAQLIASPQTAESKTVPAAAKAEPAVLAPPVPAPNPTVAAASTVPASALVSGPGFLARYQLFITGLVLLVTAFGLFGAVAIQRWRERRAEMQALAAALRGELMAAHAICRARLRSSLGLDDREITWPRLRSTLYQAYVSRLGWLGAELARHIASIYGQASDYAAYYAGDDETRAAVMPKRQALHHLTQHIDEILPRLAIIERTGSLSSPGARPPRLVGAAPIAVQPASSSPVPVPVPALASASHGANGHAVERRKVSSKSAATVSPIQLWVAMQKLARTSWKRKTAAAHDPIAEYTALIEEEMKRFSFVEEEENPDSLSESSADPWPPQKAHEAF
jgi:endonuclease YncB( thermonuclease family)